MTVGSVPRLRSAGPQPGATVHDIDMVVQPLDAPQFQPAGAPEHSGRTVDDDRGGPKVAMGECRRIPVDLYYANDDTWWTLVLIRTGPKEHNARLASLAKRRGWKLHATGEGLTNTEGERLAGESEESFFIALGIPYLTPDRRSA